MKRKFPKRFKPRYKSKKKFTKKVAKIAVKAVTKASETKRAWYVTGYTYTGPNYQHVVNNEPVVGSIIVGPSGWANITGTSIAGRIGSKITAKFIMIKTSITYNVVANDSAQNFAVRSIVWTPQKDIKQAECATLMTNLLTTGQVLNGLPGTLQNPQVDKRLIKTVRDKLVYISNFAGGKVTHTFITKVKVSKIIRYDQDNSGVFDTSTWYHDLYCNGMTCVQPGTLYIQNVYSVWYKDL